MYPPPPSSFQPPPSSLQHPQPYQNQNITCNWSISPDLGGKIQSCLFCLKVGTHDILEVPIPNPHLYFWKSDPKIYFSANLGEKSESCSFCLKIGTDSISRMIILIPRLVFWISNSKSNKHTHKHTHRVSRGCRFLFWD